MTDVEARMAVIERAVRTVARKARCSGRAVELLLACHSESADRVRVSGSFLSRGDRPRLPRGTKAAQRAGLIGEWVDTDRLTRAAEITPAGRCVLWQLYEELGR